MTPPHTHVISMSPISLIIFLSLRMQPDVGNTPNETCLRLAMMFLPNTFSPQKMRPILYHTCQLVINTVIVFSSFIH